MKFILAALILTGTVASNALSLAKVVEKSSHAIMNLTRDGKLPAKADQKINSLKATAAGGAGFKVVAILDHDVAVPSAPATISLVYDAVGKLVSYQYKEGNVSTLPSSFSSASAAKLFDLAAEVLVDSDKAEFLKLAEQAGEFRLRYDNDKNLAHFQVITTDGKVLNIWLSLEGKLVSYKF